jgi:hypothetical protein
MEKDGKRFLLHLGSQQWHISLVELRHLVSTSGDCISMAALEPLLKEFVRQDLSHSRLLHTAAQLNTPMTAKVSPQERKDLRARGARKRMEIWKAPIHLCTDESMGLTPNKKSGGYRGKGSMAHLCKYNHEKGDHDSGTGLCRETIKRTGKRCACRDFRGRA